jgi:hypothetical protein
LYGVAVAQAPVSVVLVVMVVVEVYTGSSEIIEIKTKKGEGWLRRSLCVS